MGANGEQDLTFEELGVTISLSHDANAGNVTGAGIATSFNTTTVVSAATSSASFRVGSEVGDDITLSFTDMRSSALGNGSKLSTLLADNSASSEEHTSELQSLMPISYAVFGLTNTI